MWGKTKLLHQVWTALEMIYQSTIHCQLPTTSGFLSKTQLPRTASRCPMLIRCFYNWLLCSGLLEEYIPCITSTLSVIFIPLVLPYITSRCHFISLPGTRGNERLIFYFFFQNWPMIVNGGVTAVRDVDIYAHRELSYPCGLGTCWFHTRVV